MHSWRVLLLPFLDGNDLYEQYDFSQPWNSEANLRLAEKMPPVYAFHGERKPGRVTTNYLAVIGETTAWPGGRSRKYDDVTDGTSNTILVIENLDANVHWMEPRDFQLDTINLKINSPDGVSSKYLTPAAAMLDGSVAGLDEDLSPDTFRALLTADGGEPLRSTGNGWRLIPDGRLRAEQAPDTE